MIQLNQLPHVSYGPSFIFGVTNVQGYPGLLRMLAKYFRFIADHGNKEARTMDFLVEQGHEAVNSLPYRVFRESLAGKLEMEASKPLAKFRLEKASKKKNKESGASSAADSE